MRPKFAHKPTPLGGRRGPPAQPLPPSSPVAPLPHTSPRRERRAQQAVRTLATATPSLSLNSPNAWQNYLNLKLHRLVFPLPLLPLHVNSKDRSKAPPTFDQTSSTFLGHAATLLTPPSDPELNSHSSVPTSAPLLPSSAAFIRSTHESTSLTSPTCGPTPSRKLINTDISISHHVYHRGESR